MLELQRKEESHQDDLELECVFINQEKSLEKLTHAMYVSPSLDTEITEAILTTAVDDDQSPPPPTTSSFATHAARKISRLSRRSFDRSRKFLEQTWRERPRESNDLRACAQRNFITLFVVFVTGVVTWEISVDALRSHMHLSAVFPLYLPHAVTLSLATLWRYHIAPGNMVGLYLSTIYMSGRGSGYTSTNTTVVFVVCLLATLQSHIGAFFMWWWLCRGRSKLLPTIDTVADAVYFLLTVTLTSFVFCSAIALVVAASPLVAWRRFLLFWATWWLGVLAAMITVTPLIVHLMAWRHQPTLSRPAKLFEYAVAVIATVGVMSAVFFIDVHHFRPLPYLCFPLITYTALRFNRVGWAFTVTTIAFICTLGSIRQRGAVHAIVLRPAPYSPDLLLQIEMFSIVMGVVSITLAAAVKEKKSLARTLHQMNIELECKVENRTSELRKANEALQVSQKKAEMASHAKSDFLANMSHEIRTPIHGILGLTALLLESELTEDQTESLVSVKECADLLLHIINNVLDLAKIEAGRLEVERVPFNIRKIVSSTMSMLQPRAQERGLQLLWEVDKGIPQSLGGDVGKLQQCLLNLVGNALKFTHVGSVSVHVRVASDSLKASIMSASHNRSSNNELSSRVAMAVADTPVAAHPPESLFLHFEVHDTGIGINKEKQNEMFRPFTQADASTSRLYGGTGLGLCIVHRFVELLGGAIWVESELGNGSSFQFCLPLFLNAPTTPRMASAEVSPRVRSPGKVDTKPWSLVDSAPESRTLKNSSSDSSAQSANDNMEMRKGVNCTVILIGDLSTSVLEKQEDVNNESGRRCSLCSLQNFSPLGMEDDSSRCARRASFGSFYESLKEPHSARRNSFEYGISRARRNHFRGHWDRRKTPRRIGGFEGVSISRVLSEGKRGDAVRLQHSSDESDYSPPSEHSRESSSELEKMLQRNIQLRILLAEDNPINQRIASRQLQKHGHVVTIVDDGQQALETVSAQHDLFDLVLMDVQMPVMDGLYATEQIRKTETEKGWSRVPILGLTAHAFQGYQDTCLIHGMDGYLGKPFDILQLLKTIGHMLPREKLGQ